MPRNELEDLFAWVARDQAAPVAEPDVTTRTYRPSDPTGFVSPGAMAPITVATDPQGRGLGIGPMAGQSDEDAAAGRENVANARGAGRSYSHGGGEPVSLGTLIKGVRDVYSVNAWDIQKQKALGMLEYSPAFGALSDAERKQVWDKFNGTFDRMKQLAFERIQAAGRGEQPTVQDWSQNPHATERWKQFKHLYRLADRFLDVERTEGGETTGESARVMRGEIMQEVKPGERDEFLKIVGERARPSDRDIGGKMWTAWARGSQSIGTGIEGFLTEYMDYIPDRELPATGGNWSPYVNRPTAAQSKKAQGDFAFWRKLNAVRQGGDPTTVDEDSLLVQGFIGAIEMAPPMIASAVMPGGAAGTTAFWVTQTAPPLLHDMEEAGIDRSIAVPLSLLGGLANAAVETMQVKGLMPQHKKLLRTAQSKLWREIARTIIARGGRTYLHEMGEEGVQEIVDLLTKAAASEIQNKLKGTDLEHFDWDTEFRNSFEGLKKAALSMPFLLGPGAAVDVAQAPGRARGAREQEGRRFEAASGLMGQAGPWAAEAVSEAAQPTDADLLRNYVQGAIRSAEYQAEADETVAKHVDPLLEVEDKVRGETEGLERIAEAPAVPVGEERPTETVPTDDELAVMGRRELKAVADRLGVPKTGGMSKRRLAERVSERLADLRQRQDRIAEAAPEMPVPEQMQLAQEQATEVGRVEQLTRKDAVAEAAELGIQAGGRTKQQLQQAILQAKGLAEGEVEAEAPPTIKETQTVPIEPEPAVEAAPEPPPVEAPKPKAKPAVQYPQGMTYDEAKALAKQLGIKIKGSKQKLADELAKVLGERARVVEPEVPEAESLEGLKARQTELLKAVMNEEVEDGDAAADELEALQARITELEGERKAPEPKKVAAKPAPVEAKKPLWQMTRAEFNRTENAPLVEAIQQALRDGRPIEVRTQLRVTRLSSPEHLRLTSSGEVQTQERRGKWVFLTQDQVYALAAQAGVKLPGPEDRVYHSAEVERAVEAGKPVPPEVLAGYPRLAEPQLEAEAPPAEAPKQGEADEERAGEAERGPEAGAGRTAPTAQGTRVKGRATRVGKREAHYEVVEAADLIPSHHPNYLNVNEEFPTEWQKHQRRYEKLPPGQRAEIAQPTGGFDPDIVLDPTRGHERGPTMVVERDGKLYVVGGTRRFLMLSHHQAQGGRAYHDALALDAETFGVDPDSVNEMDRPVLVRVIDTPGNVATLIDQLNIDEQFVKDVSAEAASLGRAIGDHTIRVLRNIREDETLNKFLSRKGMEVLEAMQQDDPDMRMRVTGWVKNKKLTKAAKLDIQMALLGAVIDNAALLSQASPALVKSVEGSLAELIALNRKGGEWAMGARLLQAIEYDAAYRTTGGRTKKGAGRAAIEGWMDQGSFADEVEGGKNREHEGYRLWRYLLEHGGVRKFRDALRRTMMPAAKLETGGPSLFGAEEPSMTGQEAFAALLADRGPVPAAAGQEPGAEEAGVKPTAKPMSKAKFQAAHRAHMAAQRLIELAEKEGVRHSATRKARMEKEYTSLRTNASKLGVKVPALGTFFDAEEYRRNAEKVREQLPEWEGISRRWMEERAERQRKLNEETKRPIKPDTGPTLLSGIDPTPIFKKLAQILRSKDPAAIIGRLHEVLTEAQKAGIDLAGLDWSPFFEAEPQKSKGLKRPAPGVRKTLADWRGHPWANAILNAVGNEALANPFQTPDVQKAQDYVDDLRTAAGVPERVKNVDTQAQAMKLVAEDPEGQRSRVYGMIDRGEAFTGLDTEIAKIVVEGDTIDAINEGNADRVMSLLWAYRKSGTISATALQSRKRTLLEQILSPSKKVGKKLNAAEKAKDKRAADDARKEWAKEIERLRKLLEDDGIKLSDIPTIAEDYEATYRLSRYLSVQNASYWDKLYSLWQMGILSGLKTQAANISGNVGFATYEFGLRRPIETLLNTVLRRPGGATWGEWRYIVLGMGEGVLEGAVYAKRALATGHTSFEREMGRKERHKIRYLPLIGGKTLGWLTSKLGKAAGRAIAGKKGAEVGRRVGGRMGREIGAEIGFAISYPFRWLGAMDEFAKVIVAYSDVGAKAYRIARVEGKRGARVQQRIDELVENPKSEAWDKAMDQALRQTFQRKTGAVADVIKFAKQKLPGVRYQFPFVDTPANLLKEGFMLTPLGVMKLPAAVLRDIKSGDYGDSMDILARQVIAWSVVGLVAHMLNEGDDDDPWITGSIPRDAWDERTQSYRTIPAMSFKVGDNYWSYARLDPGATALALTVDALQAIKGGRTVDVLTVPFVSILNQVTEKSYLQGVNALAEAALNYKKIPRLVGRFATSWVPNIVKDVHRAGRAEYTQRKLWDYSDQWYKQFLHRTAARLELGLVPEEPSFDVWGRKPLTGIAPIPVSDWLWRFASPVKVMKEDIHPGDQVMLNWNGTHPGGEKYIRAADPWYSKKKGAKKQYMTDAQYAQYAQLSGEIADKLVRAETLHTTDPKLADVAAVKGAVSDARKIARDALIVEWGGGEKAALDTDKVATEIRRKHIISKARVLARHLPVRKDARAETKADQVEAREWLRRHGVKRAEALKVYRKYVSVGKNRIKTVATRAGYQMRLSGQLGRKD